MWLLISPTVTFSKVVSVLGLIMQKMQCAVLAFPRVTELKVASDVNERLMVPHGLPPLQDLVRFRELYKEGKEILR